MTTITIKVELMETHEHEVIIDGNALKVHQRLYFDTSIIAIETDSPDSIPAEFKLDATSLNYVVVELGEITYEEWEPADAVKNKTLEEKLLNCLEDDQVLTEWQNLNRSEHIYTIVNNWEFLS